MFRRAAQRLLLPSGQRFASSCEALTSMMATTAATLSTTSPLQIRSHELSLEGFGFVGRPQSQHLRGLSKVEDDDEERLESAAVVQRVLTRCEELADRRGMRRKRSLDHGLRCSTARSPSDLVLSWLRALDRNSLENLIIVKKEEELEEAAQGGCEDGGGGRGPRRPWCRLEADLSLLPPTATAAATTKMKMR